MTKTTRKITDKKNPGDTLRSASDVQRPPRRTATSAAGRLRRRNVEARRHDERVDDEHEQRHDGWSHDDKPATSETGSRVDNTDDPVRMYLMQMGQIPLLKRAEEIGAAREIEADSEPLPPLACWPPTSCCTAPCWRCSRCLTASCGWTARSKCR